MSNDNSNNESAKKKYVFGELTEYDLEKIETEVLRESVYLDVFAGSDIAFKEDCQKLDSQDVLEKLNTLQAYSFNYKTTEFPENKFPIGEQFGFMAQDLEKVFPQLVSQDASGNKFVNYTQVIPLMAETIKLLSDKVDSLEKKLDQLKN
jgi:hypothetical protein